MLAHIINALISHAPSALSAFTVIRVHGITAVCRLVTAHGQLYAGDCYSAGPWQ